MRNKSFAGWVRAYSVCMGFARAFRLAAMEHPELKTVFYRAAMVQIAEARWIRVSGCGGLQNRLPS